MSVVARSFGCEFNATINRRQLYTQLKSECQLTSIVDLLQSLALVVTAQNLVGEGRNLSDAPKELIKVGQFYFHSLSFGGHLLAQVVCLLEDWAGEAIHGGGSSQEDGGNQHRSVRGNLVIYAERCFKVMLAIASEEKEKTGVL